MPLDRLDPRDLPGTLDALEAIVTPRFTYPLWLGPASGASGNHPVIALRRLATPAVLDDLFRLALGRAIRRGPGTEPSPGSLVAMAAVGAAGGAVPLATSAALRALLERLERRLAEGGFLHPPAQPWWRPLPGPTGLERKWRRLEGAGWVALPDSATLAEAFEGDVARGSLVRELVAGPLAARVADELAAAEERGALALAPGGVGADDRRSEHRTDSVVYLAGTEPELLDAAPDAAALVQWLRGPGAERLAAALEPHLGPLHPPQRAMLARFRGPAAGFAPHLDNPAAAGGADNGRSATLVLYLGDPRTPPAGGEIALWAPGAGTDDPPARVAPPSGGTAALFDSRRVLHQVRPLEAGPDRWALTLWLSDRPQAPPSLAATAREAGVDDVLAGDPAPSLPPGRVLVHEVTGRPPGRFAVWPPPVGEAATRPPTAGVVTTVHGAGQRLDAWVDHHLEVGFDRLVIVFDRPDEPAEAATIERLRESAPSERLLLWRGDEVAERWAELAAAAPSSAAEVAGLRRLAGGAGAAWAVAARQALNASVALEAVRGELDWLLHLDADELFRPAGRARGGASVAEHFAAATAAGRRRLRYVDHELLEPPAPGAPARFKVNPRLAETRLGRRGFSTLVAHLGAGQAAERPYFRAYTNGKSAVAVAAASGAAGVHGWRLVDETTAEGEAAGEMLAGPEILHVHLPTPATLVAKYRAMAAAPAAPEPVGDDAGRPFPPSALEAAACALVREARAARVPEEELDRRLALLWRRVTSFAADEVALLGEAGLLLDADLDPAWFY